MEKEAIERSIIKTFRKPIWRLFVRAVNRYKLINDGDKILVCISGGKDSFLLAKCMEELKRHGKFDFELKYLVMDPGYKKEVVREIKDLADLMGLDIIIAKSDVFKVSTKLNRLRPCYMCARMRRGFLYSEAERLGCNKIALGHHFDDVVETTLMSLFYNGEFKTMMPRLQSTNFEGLELIRPLYLVKEKDIIAWKNHNNLNFINCACSFSEKEEELGKRFEIKEFIKEYKKINPSIDVNIFRALEKVNLDTIISYRKGDSVKSILDE